MRRDRTRTDATRWLLTHGNDRRFEIKICTRVTGFSQALNPILRCLIYVKRKKETNQKEIKFFSKELFQFVCVRYEYMDFNSNL